MLKALIKKELAQLGQIYLYDSRRKKRRSPGSTALFVLLFVFVFFSIGMMFFGMAESIFPSAHEAGLDWLYFALFGLLAVGVGVIGSVFMTNSILYKAKDNELLLAMPIPPAKLLFVRILTVFVISFIGCVLVWLPAMIRYDAAMHSPFTTVLLQIMLLIALTLLVTVLSCLLGWLVSLISGRIANKTAATVIISIVFVVGYYLLYFRMSSIIRDMIANLSAISEKISRWAMPMKQLGLGAAGDALRAVLFTLACIALFVITYALLSATLVKIMTATGKVKRAVYRGGDEKQGNIRSALLMKEFKRFTGSAIYLLNAGFGVLIMIALAAAALIKAEALRGVIDIIPSTIKVSAAIIPVFALGAVCLISSTDCTSASSVSLEGKTLWQIQTMPVEPAEALAAKLKLHVIVNAIPAAILALAIGIVLKADWLTSALLILGGAGYVWLCGAFGLIMNLKKPTLDWTNEAVPVKQGTPVLFTMLFGFVGSVVIIALGALLTGLIGARAALAVIAFIIILLSWLFTRWIMTKGAKIFAELN